MNQEGNIMALLDRLGEIVKSAAEKTEELTKTLGEKAEAALEIQRLNSQVSKENNTIINHHKQMGELLWANFEAGEEVPEEFKEHCTEISVALTKIEELKMSISKIKAVSFAGEEPKILCPHCNARVAISAKFCGECGEKMPIAPDIPEVVEADLDEAPASEEMKPCVEASEEKTEEKM